MGLWPNLYSLADLYGAKMGKASCNSIWVTEPRAAKLQLLLIPVFLGNGHLKPCITSPGALGSSLLSIASGSSSSRRGPGMEEGAGNLPQGPFRPLPSCTCSCSCCPWDGPHPPFPPAPPLQAHCAPTSLGLMSRACLLTLLGHYAIVKLTFHFSSC